MRWITAPKHIKREEKQYRVGIVGHSFFSLNLMVPILFLLGASFFTAVTLFPSGFFVDMAECCDYSLEASFFVELSERFIFVNWTETV